MAEAKTAEQPVLRVDPLPVPAARGPGVSPWAWPAGAIVIVATAGDLHGVPGAVAGFAGCLAVACVLLGRHLDRRERVVAQSLGIVFAGAAAFALSPYAQLLSSSPAANLQGRRVNAEMLTSIDLRGAWLNGAQLTGLDLRRKDLTGVTGPGADFGRTQLNGVSLRGANLRGADLSGACLRGADLREADLSGADVSGADLSGALVDPASRRTWIQKPTRAAPNC